MLAALDEQPQQKWTDLCAIDELVTHDVSRAVTSAAPHAYQALTPPSVKRCSAGGGGGGGS